MTAFKVSNYKVSCRTSHISLDIVSSILEEKQISAKKYNNFISFNDIYTYIVFKSGDTGLNHINITKIPDRLSVQLAIKALSDLFNCEVFFYKVDNIIATFNTHRRLNLNSLSKTLTAEGFYIKYNPEKFPGLFLKESKGTIIIFHSGKTVFVGCQDEENIECLLKTLIAVI